MERSCTFLEKTNAKVDIAVRSPQSPTYRYSSDWMVVVAKCVQAISQRA